MAHVARIAVLLLGLTLAGSPLWAGLDDYVLMTEEFPPYNFVRDGQVQGISADILLLMLERLGVRKTRADLKILPWARAYNDLLHRPESLLFSMTRTPERDGLFRWVGPIAPNTNVLWAKKSRGIRLSSLKDLSGLVTGVVRDDAGEHLLLAAGAPLAALDSATDARSNLLKLAADRNDLFAYPDLVTRWVMKDIGLDPCDYEIVYTLNRGEVYYALHRSAGEEVVSRLQETLDELRREGVVEKIIRKYSE